MEKNMKKFLLSLGVAFSSIAFAQEHNHGDNHGHEDIMHSEAMHAHGVIHASIALEDNELEIELHSAAGNFLDFEYEPQTKEEKQAVKALDNVFKQESFMTLSNKAKCKLEDYDFDLESKVKHANVEVEFDYECKNINALNEIIFDFSLFPHIEKIEAQYIDDKGRSAKEILTPAQNRFSLP